MATIRDVAQAAGVSVTTVSRVLNKDAALSVSNEVRARIFQCAHALGYVSPRQRKAAEQKKASGDWCGRLENHSPGSP